MALTLAVDLIQGTYDAAEVGDRRRAEWPPHPARLFCALVAAVRDQSERGALAWLETQPPPVIAAADRAVTTLSQRYVVTNEIVAQGGSQTYPGRTNSLAVRAKALPASPDVRFVWSEADPSASTVGTLDAMARRVPYLGRSTGIALVAATVVADELTEVPGIGLFEPCDLLDSDVYVRVPYPGYLADLDARFAAGLPAWEVSRFQGYRQRTAAPELSAPDAPSAYKDVVVFRFVGLRPDGTLAPRLTEALRSRVLRAAGPSAPAVLHGHGVDGRPHVAYLALSDTGYAHSDGHLLGLAVAVPVLDPQERRQVLAAVLGLRRHFDASDSDVIGLQVPGLGQLDVTYQPGLVRPWGADPRRWRQGSTRWVSATPVVLDRYPKTPDDVEDEVRRSCRIVGLPDPVAVTVSQQPLAQGAVRLRPSDLPAKVRGRLYRHVDLRFDRRVTGPVLLGAGRYLGVGLLAPVLARDEQAPS
jgi:CRISPR-associated protein Csb2